MFASVYRTKQDELRADFQQYYGLNLERLGYEYSIKHAASLVTQLPRESRLYIAIDCRATWGITEYQLADIANSLRWLVWAQTKDGQKNRNRPEMMKPPFSTTSEAKVVVSIEDYLRISQRTRKEV